jgi:hypothetical protein
MCDPYGISDECPFTYSPLPDFAAFFALILSHFSLAVNFGLFDLLTPLSMLFAIQTSSVQGDRSSVQEAINY